MDGGLEPLASTPDLAMMTLGKFFHLGLALPVLFLHQQLFSGIPSLCWTLLSKWDNWHM